MTDDALAKVRIQLTGLWTSLHWIKQLVKAPHKFLPSLDFLMASGHHDVMLECKWRAIACEGCPVAELDRIDPGPASDSSFWIRHIEFTKFTL